MKKVLIFTNSFSTHSESFVINHIRFVASIFHTSLLIQGESIIPTGVPIIKVIQVGLPIFFFKRIIKTFNILFSNFSYFVPFLNPFKFGKNALNLSLIYTAAALKDNSFSIIHSHFGNNGLLIAQLKKAGVLDSKVITHFHGLDFTGKRYNSVYYTDLIKYGDVNISVTNFSYNELIKLGFRKETLKKISIGTNTIMFSSNINLQKCEKFKILFVGRLIELKGVLHIPFIANSLVKLGLINFKITIVGDGPLLNELVDLTNHLSDFVELKGYLNHEHIKSEMENSDIFIYPGGKDSNGRVENQCVCIQEASAMKLPIIAFDVGGISDSVVNNYNGFLIQEGKIDLFIEKIIELSTDKEKRQRFGENGRKLVNRKFELVSCLNNVVQIY